MTDDLVAVCFANHLTKALGYSPCVKDSSMDLAVDSPARLMQLNEQHIAAIKKIIVDKMAKASDWLN
jgi:hypothetical protein